MEGVGLHVRFLMRHWENHLDDCRSGARLPAVSACVCIYLFVQPDGAIACSSSDVNGCVSYGLSFKPLFHSKCCLNSAQQ